MGFWAIPAPVVIVAVAGSMSLFALIISRLCETFVKAGKHSSGKYECGFKSEGLPHYTSDKNQVISIYLLLELFVVLILTCVALNISNTTVIKTAVLSFALVCRLVEKKA